LLRVRGLFLGALVVLLPGTYLAQQEPQKPQSGAMGGVASGVAIPAVYDEQKRPMW